MLFLEFLGETDYTAVNPIADTFRTFFSLLDKAFYSLLTILYRLFFNISTWDVFGKAFFEFFNRVQIIIGVYMIFQLAITILKGILDPESFGKNTTGAKGLVPRILTSLVLLVVLLPVNIGGSGGSSEFRDRISNQGLLFGTLSSLQYRILNNNTIGRLVLGTNEDNGFTNTSSDSNSGDSELDVSSRLFVSTILRGFYRINLIPSEDRIHEEGKTDDMLNDNRVCKNISADVLNKYTRLDADPNDIIDTLGETCPGQGGLTILKWHIGDEYYAFNNFLPFISTIVGIVLCFIIISFTFDVAIRSIKLGILRLVAPIPIISHMDPNGSKDEALNTWTKTLVSTYLDLFVRLASVYFAIFLIQDMIVNGIAIGDGEGIIAGLSYTIIVISLFLFAKQVPKFIREVLGLKGEGGSLFSGLGVTAAGIGVIGSAATNWRAAHEEGKALYKDTWDKGGLKGAASRVWSAGRTGFSTVGGAIGGAYAGMSALSGKDAGIQSVLKAQASRNATRAAHSTLPGRVADNMFSMVTGKSLAESGNSKLEGAQNFVKAAGNWKKAVEDAAKENGLATNLGGGIVARYEELERAVASAHDGKVTINNQDYDSNMFTSSFMSDALQHQVEDYQVHDHAKANDKKYSKLVEPGQKLYKSREDARRAISGVDLSGSVKKYELNDVSTTGANIGAANQIASKQENDMRQRMKRANAQQKK